MPGAAQSLRFRVSPTAFFQVNTPAAEVLVPVPPPHCRPNPAPRQVLYGIVRQCALAEARGPITVLDVCCGTGTIGLGVAQHDGVAQLVGVEWSSEAVRDARHNAADNGLEHKALFVQGKAEEVIEQRLDSLLASAPEGGVVAVLDPPRVSPSPPTNAPVGRLRALPCSEVGIEPSVCEALRRRPCVNRIVFVSCNPTGRLLRKDFVVHGGSLAHRTRALKPHGTYI